MNDFLQQRLPLLLLRENFFCSVLKLLIQVLHCFYSLQTFQWGPCLSNKEFCARYFDTHFDTIKDASMVVLIPSVPFFAGYLTQQQERQLEVLFIESLL